MSLRARLTLFFVGIVVVPLVLAAFVLRLLVDAEVDRRANTRLQAGARAVAGLWEERLDDARREVAMAAQELGRTGRPGNLHLLRNRARLDFLVVTEPDGDVVAASLADPRFGPGAPDPTPAAVSGGRVFTLASEVEVAVAGREVVLVGGWFADADLAASLSRVTGLDVALAAGGRVLGSTTALPVPPLDEAPTELPDGRTALRVAVGSQGHGVVLVAPAEEGVSLIALGLVAAAGVGASIIVGYALAGVIVRPLERLGTAARQVAAGNLATTVELGGQGDIANLAEAFNTMTANLRSYVEELEGSRDELRRGLERLGSALRATHDLPEMLGVVLDTAVATLGARGGAIFLREPAGRKVRVEVARGDAPRPGATIGVGRGIAGRAATGATIRVPGPEGAPPASSQEPQSDTALAVPLESRERNLGAIALYGRTVPEPFQDDEARTLQWVAAQAAVAIENVVLHEEAQRLSVTDSLTGTANRRALQTVLAREVQRAQRFGRPLSVLLLDLDRFKQVNDRYGHRRGDEVLVQITRRIRSRIRTEIDTVARYGGEEFVLVLPETPEEGARAVAEKIRRGVRERALGRGGSARIRMTVSVGTATFPRDGSTADELLRAADQAMYRAKAEGRDRVAAARSH
jgi:two-component system cell cycle response regulator